MVSARELTIDSEFESMGRRLQPEEASLLEQDILEHGCLDPIIVWENHDNIILDGHNRYRICTETGSGFKVRAISLPDREACLEWIDKHQLGKRNLTDVERTVYQGRLYKRRKHKNGGDRKSKSVCQNDKVISTAVALSAELGDVSPATLVRAGKFVDALDAIEVNVSKEAKDEILSGKSGLSKGRVVEIAQQPAEKQAEAFKLAKEGDTPAKQPERESNDPCGDIIAALHRLTKSPSLVAPYSEIKRLVSELREAYRKQYRSS
jgi:hypothetical protein